MFKRKLTDNPVSERAAEFTARSIHRMQTGFATWMGEKTESFGRRGKIGLLAVVCLVFGGMSIASLVGVFTGSDDSRNWKPAQVRMPGHYDKTGEASANEIAVVSPSAYIKMKAFRRYMDSLQKTNTGKLTYDSIMKARPGLMDSVLYLEELYHSQQNGAYGK